MQSNGKRLDRLEQALWRASARGDVLPDSLPSLEAWQAGVLRAIRLTADRTVAEAEFSWLALQRATVGLVLAAVLSGLLVWHITPATETDLAQETWQNHADLVLAEAWNGE